MKKEHVTWGWLLRVEGTNIHKEKCNLVFNRYDCGIRNVQPCYVDIWVKECSLPSSPSVLWHLSTLLSTVTSSSLVSDSNVLLNHIYQPSLNFFILIIPGGLSGWAEILLSHFLKLQIASLIIGLASFSEIGWLLVCRKDKAVEVWNQL